jgi:hypothetical protein
LTDPDNRDPLSGFPVFKALLCDVVKTPRHAANAPAAQFADAPDPAKEILTNSDKSEFFT